MNIFEETICKCSKHGKIKRHTNTLSLYPNMLFDQQIWTLSPSSSSLFKINILVPIERSFRSPEVKSKERSCDDTSLLTHI